MNLLFFSCKKEKVINPIPEPKPILPNIKEDEIITIPVIFHIIHNGENVGKGNNVSYSIIKKQLQDLNNTFRNIVKTSIDIKIEFKLAIINPQNDTLTESGVERIYNEETMFNYNDLFDKNKCEFVYKSMWDVNKYINIWIAPIENRTSAATLPYTSSYNYLTGLKVLDDYWFNKQPLYTDGIVLNTEVIREEYLYNKSYYTLTHEMGHYFGLFHVFNDNDCVEDDYCEDTYHYNRSLYDYSMQYKRLTCSGLLIYADNFMDYDYCYNYKFTQNQYERMRNVAAFSPYRGILRFSKSKSNNKTKKIIPKPEIII